MNEKELLDSFRYLEAEQDTLRARSDALTIALRVVIQRTPHSAQLVDEILQALDGTGERGIASPQVSDLYLAGLDAMKERIARWR